MEEIYSIKMRSSIDERHVSGAENIVNKNSLNTAVSFLIERALEHSKGSADFINLKIEKIEKEEILYLPPLDVTTVNVNNVEQGFLAIKKILRDINISNDKCNVIVDMLNSIRDMRGAILLDINRMERVELCMDRGIRVSYMDLEDRTLDGLAKTRGYNTHFVEALVLATKVVNHKSIIAEICYSDDPDYTAGYISSKKFSYVRFEHLKEKGNPYGGRIFLYDGKTKDIDECIKYLEKQKVIVKNNIQINEAINFSKFMECGFSERYRK